jgi:Bacterial Ig-like domain
MISKLKLKLISALCIILFMLAASLAYAQGGGQASSPGTPGQKPLNLIAMTVAGGGNVQNATDITTEPQFVLEFDKNVVNGLIWGNNSKCFSLTSTDNTEIPISVTKVDDTIDVTKRQNIFVQPVNPLSPGTAYYFKISPELKAKNGVTLGGMKGEGVSITFRTRGETTVQLSQSANESASQGHSGSPATSANIVTSKDLNSKDQQLTAKTQEQSQVTTDGERNGKMPVATDKSTQDLDPKLKETQGNLANWKTPIGVFLIAGWIVMEILIKRKKKQ